MSTRPRILHLIASNFVGGPERQILAHAAAMHKSDMELWVGSFVENVNTPDIIVRARELHFPTLEIQCSWTFNPVVVKRLVEALKQNQINLLCTHGYKANILGRMASLWLGCPQIAFVRGWTAETSNVALYESVERQVLSGIPWVACVSRPQAQRLRVNRRHELPEPVVIPNAALFPVVEPVSLARRRELRQRLRIPCEAFIIGAAGRLSAEKGHYWLLRASREVIAKIPNSHIVILGEGRELIRLQAEAANLGIADRVSFPGFQPQVRDWIQAFDVLANPSLTEGTPNILLESMSLGTPVVATSVGGVPDLLESETEALLVPAGHADDLAAAILKLHDDPQLARRLAAGAQDRVRWFSVSRQCQELRELYISVLNCTGASGLESSAAIAPFISVVLPVRNEETHLPDLLEQLATQDYPRNRFEIIVADGNSTDRTPHLVHHFAQTTDIPVTYLQNHGVKSSSGRNVGIKNSRGDVILFIDGHCSIPNRHLLTHAALAMKMSRADCLCRPQPLIASEGLLFQHTVCAVRASTLGHGLDSSIYSNRQGYVNPMSAGAAYTRRVFDRIGWYDENFDACEDVEFNYRVHRAGFSSFIDPKLAILYSARSSLRGLAKQMVRYGEGRCRLLRKHRSAASVGQLILPACLLLAAILAITSALVAISAKILLTIVTVYSATILLASGVLSARYRKLLWPAPLVYATIHFGLAVGFWQEYLRGIKRGVLPFLNLMTPQGPQKRDEGEGFKRTI